MALRKIYLEKEEILHKVCRPVTDFNERLWQLLDDMAETMYHADGVGLAAPQVGILRRAVVIDTGEGLIELVNPKIVMSKGNQLEVEGCLSCPGEYGKVKRPARVKVEAQNRFGDPVEYVGTDLLARAFCHEIDHLDGIMFKDKVVEMVQVED
ncbi:MAG TPA: peptide deformylase [Candidatus Egerieicola pullicola]|uniref:Peptide deformylase n=1 Tax=Candidatus Egerieicola pullicola TaxID=2840775 RepID=A0A9D1AKB5_9FIRM|nr:peptide deformylase [Candidatus Egerieicola pullicola]